MTKEHYRPKYQQPHNIHFNTGNPSLDAHLRDKEHRRQRYKARYVTSTKEHRENND